MPTGGKAGRKRRARAYKQNAAAQAREAANSARYAEGNEARLALESMARIVEQADAGSEGDEPTDGDKGKEVVVDPSMNAREALRAKMRNQILGRQMATGRQRTRAGTDRATSVIEHMMKNPGTNMEDSMRSMGITGDKVNSTISHLRSNPKARRKMKKKFGAGFMGGDDDEDGGILSTKKDSEGDTTVETKSDTIEMLVEEIDSNADMEIDMDAEFSDDDILAT